MSQERDSTPLVADEDVKRVGALSDGVFAIAITLLVLDFKHPDPSLIHSSADLRNALAQWSDYQAYVLSFAVVALYWEAHWQTFKQMVSMNRTALWLNMLFLMGIAFVPYPTSIISEFSEFGAATIFYAGTLAAIGFVWAGLWNYSVREGLLQQPDDPRETADSRYQVLLTPIVFLVSMLIATRSPDLAQWSWSLILVGRLVFPIKRRLRPESEPVAS